MIPIRQTLGQGIDLTIVRDDRFKQNSLSVNFLSNFDPICSSAAYLVPAVMQRGTSTYPTMAAISRRLDYLYAANIGGQHIRFGNTRVQKINCSWLDDSFVPGQENISAQVMEFFAEYVFSPLLKEGTFSSEYVESEKSNLVDAVLAEINDKQTYAYHRTQRELGRGTVLAHAEHGTIEQIKGVTARDVYAQYREMIDTHAVQVFYIGRGETDEIVDMVKNMLAPLFESKTRQIFVPCLREVMPSPVESLHVVEEEQVMSGAVLNLGLHCPVVMNSEDYAKFILFNEILSGSPTARLFMNVREKHSLCYYCYAVVEPMLGMMIISSGIEASKREFAERAILAEIADIAAGNVTDEELKNAVLSLKNGLVTMTDSMRMMEWALLRRFVAGLEPVSLDESMKRIEAVTVADIADMAKRMQHDMTYFLRGGEDE